MVKTHESKCQNYFPVTTTTRNGIVKWHCVKQGKMMDIDYCEEYLKGIYQILYYIIKYYYGSVNKSTFSFSSDMQIDKKIQCKRRYKEKN